MLHFTTALLSESDIAQSLQLLWTVAYQAPLSMGFSMQEYWNGLPCPSLGDLSDPGKGIKPMSSEAPALQGDSFITEPLGKPLTRLWENN